MPNGFDAVGRRIDCRGWGWSFVRAVAAFRKFPFLKVEKEGGRITRVVIRSVGYYQSSIHLCASRWLGILALSTCDPTRAANKSELG